MAWVLRSPDSSPRVQVCPRGGWSDRCSSLAVALAWKEHPTVPRWGRTASLAVVGGILAATFRPSVLPLVAGHWLPVTLVVGGTLFLSLGAGLLLSGLVRIDRKTAALGRCRVLPRGCLR